MKHLSMTTSNDNKRELILQAWQFPHVRLNIKVIVVLTHFKMTKVKLYNSRVDNRARTYYYTDTHCTHTRIVMHAHGHILHNAHAYILHNSDAHTHRFTHIPGKSGSPVIFNEITIFFHKITHKLTIM